MSQISERLSMTCVYGCFDMDFEQLFSSFVSVCCINQSIYLILLFAFILGLFLDLPHDRHHIKISLFTLKTIYKHNMHQHPLWFLVQIYIHHYIVIQIGFNVNQSCLIDTQEIAAHYFFCLSFELFHSVRL